MTLIALTGHLFSHRRHCIQSDPLAGKAFFSEVGWPGVSIHSYSFTGQTSMHMPQPSHISQSTATLVPRIPSFSGGSTGPQMAMPSSLPTFFLFFWKSGSMGTQYTYPLIQFTCRELGRSGDKILEQFTRRKKEGRWLLGDASI